MEVSIVDQTRWSRSIVSAWALWVIYGILIAGMVLWTKERTVTNAYRRGVERWFSSQPLYDDSGHGFIYFPQAALTFAPWAAMPRPVGEISWRWACIGILAASVAALVRCLGGDARWFLVATLSSIATSWTSARAGQATLPMTALMIFAALCIHRRRWWAATWLLVLAVSVKPLAIVMVLLAGAIHPPMLWRLIVGFVVMGVAPFAAQSPAYVASQYQGCLDMLRAAYKQGENPADYWAQLFGMLRVFGVEVSSDRQSLSRMVAAAATLAGCWWANRRLSPVRAAWYLYGLTTCYLMLFNPRTEGNTYAMIGPLYGIMLAEAWCLRRNWRMTAALVAMVTGTVGTYELTKPFVASPSQATFLAPLMCIGATSLLIAQLVRESRRAAGDSRSPAIIPETGP
jgi:alpha-1,2-mannosyltransferase